MKNLFICFYALAVTIVMASSSCGQAPKTKEQIAQDSLQRVEEARIRAQEAITDSLKEVSMIKVKSKLKSMYPNDYITQEMLFDAHEEAYDWLIQIEPNPVLKKLQKDYPYDFITQKMLFEAQVEAAERMNQ